MLEQKDQHIEELIEQVQLCFSSDHLTSTGPPN